MPSLDASAPPGFGVARPKLTKWPSGTHKQANKERRWVFHLIREMASTRPAVGDSVIPERHHLSRR